MLPAFRIGNPKSEHWLGLIDGVYAIAMTLLAIEIPGLLGTLFHQYKDHHENLGILGIMLLYELIAYAATFLVLYEIWSFHRAAIVIGGLGRRGQNFINSFILAGACLLPGKMAHLIELKVEFVVEELIQGIATDTAIWKMLTSFPHVAGMFFLICLFCFLLIGILARSSLKASHSAALTFLANQACLRATIFGAFALITTVAWIFSYVFPPIFLILGYLIYAFYERDDPRLSA